MSVRYCLVLLLGLLLSGCTTEYNLATGQQESLMYSSEKEVKIGDAVAVEIAKNFKFINDLDSNARVQEVFDRIVAVCDRKDLVFTVRIIDDDTVNAFSIPGGYVYIHKGLLEKLKTDDQLAGVLAHEIGHITAKHALKRIQKAYGYTLLQVAAVGSGSSDLAQGVSFIVTSLYYAYSREDEFQSDQLAVKYMKLAGYDPVRMIDVLEVLKSEDEKRPAGPPTYFRTHPYPNERMAIVNKEITGQIGFKDYLNLTGDEK